MDNVEAVWCADDAACGTLVISVTPAAEIFVDERSLGVATVLQLPLSPGRHRVRLETIEWRFHGHSRLLPARLTRSKSTWSGAASPDEAGGACVDAGGAVLRS